MNIQDYIRLYRKHEKNISLVKPINTLTRSAIKMNSSLSRGSDFVISTYDDITNVINIRDTNVKDY